MHIRASIIIIKIYMLKYMHVHHAVYKHKELDFKVGHSEFAEKKDRGLALWLLRETG